MTASKAVPRPAPYRIKDLVRLTGTTKETIHYYITEGLLPKAKKTARNMAWYGDEHVRRLKKIKELQEKQFLPLKAIKAVLTDAKEYAFTPGQQRTIEGLQQQLLADDEAAADLVPLKELLERYAIDDQELAKFEASELIKVRRKKDGAYVKNEDEFLFQTWTRLRDLGFTRERGFEPSDLEAFENVAALLLDQGVRVMTSRIDEFDRDEAVKIFHEAVPLVNELVGFYHTKKVKEFLVNFRGDARDATPKEEP